MDQPPCDGSAELLSFLCYTHRGSTECCVTTEKACGVFAPFGCHSLFTLARGRIFNVEEGIGRESSVWATNFRLERTTFRAKHPDLPTGATEERRNGKLGKTIATPSGYLMHRQNQEMQRLAMRRRLSIARSSTLLTPQALRPHPPMNFYSSLSPADCGPWARSALDAGRTSSRRSEA